VTDPVKTGSPPVDGTVSEVSPVEKTPPEDPAASEVPSHYRIHLLPGAKPTERGVLYRRGGERFLLDWGRVRCAFAAQVGGPGEKRWIAFDLAVETSGPVCVACRMMTEPGEEAMRIARAILLGVAHEACNPCIQSLAADGVPCLSFLDTETFGEAVLESIRFLGSARRLAG
jgi:hypothetical protein